ncbi:MAG: glycosyltransferase family 2 protein [Myxococcales bacterium]|nr:glycosyltransferase family 2 protein [Myxococcales bacterium]
MKRIIAAAPVRNETRRFLNRWLEAVLRFADRLVVLDDAGDDDTAEMCRRRGDRVIVHSLAQPSLLVQETRTRSLLWEHVRREARPGDWIALLDADEIPSEPLIALRNTILALPDDIGRLDAKWAEMWTESHYRVDGLWSPWLTLLVRFEDRPFCADPDLTPGLHVPRFPEYVGRLVPHPLDAPVLHLGYCRGDLREEKAAFYVAHNEGVHLAHARTILEPAKLAPLEALLTLPRVVLTVPIRNRAWAVPKLVENLSRLDYPDDRLRVRFVVNDSTDDTDALLLAWRRTGMREHVEVVRLNLSDPAPPGEHQWWGPASDPGGPLRRMAKLRNSMLAELRDSNADVMLALDSDVLLHPQTIRHLAATGADIVSPVFWASWGLRMGPLFGGVRVAHGRVDIHHRLQAVQQGKRPQVWERGSSASSEPWLMDLVFRSGLHRVGGLGAVTWIRKQVALAGVSYDEVPNLPEDYCGEDRHFCVRAVCHGFDLWASSYLETHHRDEPDT